MRVNVLVWDTMSVQRGGVGSFRYCFYYCATTDFEIYDLETEDAAKDARYIRFVDTFN